MKQNTRTFRWGVGVLLTSLAAAGLLVACNTHPVELAQASGAITEHEDYTPGSAAAIDILWVIDNSGSMCEEQEALRDNFQAFIKDISDRNIDFHIGVTTTQMRADVSLETVARPGELQSMPQPVVTYPTCIGDQGDPGNDYDGFATIRANLHVAIDKCSKDPAAWEHLKDVTDDEIICHLDKSCGQYWELFPTTPSGEQPRSDHSEAESPYRTIPKVLTAENYRDDTGRLNVNNLERDFSCMSMVGTSGYGIEKGLSAAVEAVSPEKTGGPVDVESPADPAAPNHGFLRQNSNLALIFVTDENDCTHDGSLIEESVCSGHACAFANNPNLADSPLIPTADLKDQFVSNLSESKAREVDSNSLVVASIHGRPFRYGVDYPDPDSEGQPFDPDLCTKDRTEEPPEAVREQYSCENELGKARSGDRYESFLREFNPANVFPSPEDYEGSLPGLICTGDFAQTLADLGEKVANVSVACIDDPPYECETADDCFDFMFGEGTPECLPFAETDRKYCTSGLQVRMYPDGKLKGFSDLQDHDYCIPESIDSVMTPGGCVVKPEMYEMITCPSGKDLEMSLDWQDDLFHDALQGYNVEMVYTLRPDESGQEEAANNAEE